MTTSRYAANEPNAGARGLLTARLFWVALAAIGIVAFFWDGLWWLGKAWLLPEYSYGPIIPFIAAYIALRELSRGLPERRQGDGLIGLGLVLTGMVIGLLGNLARMQLVSLYGLYPALVGLYFLIFGTKGGFRLWVSWIYLLFMLPLPSILYFRLSFNLQLLSSEIGVALINMMHIPVYLEGNVIDLGIYKLQVAEACSGLRYLFPLMSFGFLFAVLFRGPFWARAILFVSTIPITVLMNSFRIGVIGMLVSRFGTEQAEGFLHLFEGWVIFILCILLLVLEAMLLDLVRGRRRSVLDAFDFDASWLGMWRFQFKGKIGGVNRASAAPSLIAAACLVCLSGAAWQLTPARAQVIPDRQSLALFPMQAGGWRGSSIRLDPEVERELGADDYLEANYNRGANAPFVNFLIAYYANQTFVKGVHAPEKCIPGGGWAVQSWTPKRLAFALPHWSTLTVNSAIIQKGQERQLVYYWYNQRGHQLTGYYETAFYKLWDAVVSGRSDGGLVRVITPITLPGGIAAAERRMHDFLKTTLPLLPAYVPK